MNHRRPRFWGSLIAFAFLLPTAAWAAGGTASGEAPQPGSHLQMAMTLYAGGITLGNITMDATMRPGDYHLVANLQTGGMVNALWQAEIQATASGKIQAGKVLPAFYDSFNTRRDKRQQISLTYDNGDPRLYANPPYNVTDYAVTAPEKKNTLDPLSAVLFIVSGLGADAADPCSVTAHVFDGRRRYDVELSKAKPTQIKMDNGLYSGPALQCQIAYKQLAGYKPQLLKNSEDFPPIHAWIARFPSTVRGRAYTVPLRVWAKTSYGVIAAVATSLKVDGAAPKSPGK
jgi:hypothetical protein